MRDAARPTKAFVLWLTGLSGSGKTTLANRIYEYIEKRGLSVEKLDGDILRGLFPSTGFSRAQDTEDESGTGKWPTCTGQIHVIR